MADQQSPLPRARRTSPISVGVGWDWSIPPTGCPTAGGPIGPTAGAPDSPCWSCSQRRPHRRRQGMSPLVAGQVIAMTTSGLGCSAVSRSPSWSRSWGQALQGWWERRAPTRYLLQAGGVWDLLAHWRLLSTWARVRRSAPPDRTTLIKFVLQIAELVPRSSDEDLPVMRTYRRKEPEWLVLRKPSRRGAGHR
jgi:hypothetical protein